MEEQQTLLEEPFNKKHDEELKQKLEEAGISYEDWLADATLSTLSLMEELEEEKMSLPRRAGRKIVKGSKIFGKVLKNVMVWLLEQRKKRKDAKQTVASKTNVSEAATIPIVDEDIKSVIKESIQLANKEVENERHQAILLQQQLDRDYQKQTKQEARKNAILIRQIKANNFNNRRKALGVNPLSGLVIFLLIGIIGCLLTGNVPSFLTNLLS
ncbi:hypothetical protein JR536_002996 [Listeria monocytogenes]|nr:hypothetical protein [Listeria monocytogenes]